MYYVLCVVCFFFVFKFNTTQADETWEVIGIPVYTIKKETKQLKPATPAAMQMFVSTVG